MKSGSVNCTVLIKERNESRCHERKPVCGRTTMRVLFASTMTAGLGWAGQSFIPGRVVVCGREMVQ